MSRRAIAALIWVGTSVVMAALVVSVMVASSIDHWASWSLLTWIDVLIPNLLLIVLPGALSAAGYLFISARMQGDRGTH
ncbi:MAG TPA: hypothetical protein VIO80_06570 [Candidatus Dormibacteraeota bacterium]|jgi:hypothetical protein